MEPLYKYLYYSQGVYTGSHSAIGVYDLNSLIGCNAVHKNVHLLHGSLIYHASMAGGLSISKSM